MLNKKVKLLLFIFLILLCISTANAKSIDNVTDIPSVDIINVESETYVATIAETEGSFSDLYNDINNAQNELKLNKSYKYSDTSDHSYSDGIIISKNLTIYGQGNVIDGNHEASAFHVQNGVTLILKNITLSNCSSSSGGGAIYNCGNLTVIDSTFINNTAYSNGGAIDNYKANSTIINSRFEYNTANVNGGAIHNSESNEIVVNSTFHNNAAGYWGGAIYNNNMTLNLINSTFINNHANNSGGAVSSEYTNAINSTFINNTAELWGGAIQLGIGSIEGSTFINNSAFEGGAVSILYGNAVITKSNFTNNKGDYGGAIYYIDFYNYVIDSEMNYIYELNKTNPEKIKQIEEELRELGYEGNVFEMYRKYLLDEYENLYPQMFINISLTVMNSNFAENDGKFGSDIYTTHNTTLSNNNYTKSCYANIYANNTIVNGTIISVLNNNTYYLVSGDLFKLYATVFVDGASVAGYDLIITDGTKNYTAVYKGNGTYEVAGEITVDFVIKHYSAVIDADDQEQYIVKNGTVSTEKKNVTVKVDLDDVDAGGNITGNITLIDEDGEIANITGEVNVEIDGRNYTVNVTEGKGKLNIEDQFGPGNYTMDVTFPGNDEYAPANTTANFTIEDTGVVLIVHDLTKYYGNGSKFIIMLTDSKGNPIADQIINITINGVTYTRTTDENGTVMMSINLIPGVYNATVSYGDIIQNATITVLPTIEAEDLIKYFKNGTQYYAKFYNLDGTPLANTNVTFNIHGVFYTRTTNEEGIAKLNINLNPGEYIITAFNPVNNESKANVITVLTTIFGENVVKFYRNGTQYYAYVLDENGNPLANANVTFNIHGVFYNRTTDEKGIVKLNINLNPGEYILTAWNLWNGEATSNNITVYNVVESEDLEMTTQARKPFKVTILGDHGAPLANSKVVFNIHGVFYEKTTDANGQVSLDINLIAGKYIITTYYNEYSISNTIVVK